MAGETAVLSLTLSTAMSFLPTFVPERHMNLQIVMKRKDDRQLVGELEMARKHHSLLGTSSDAEFRSKKTWRDLEESAEAAYFQRRRRFRCFRYQVPKPA